MASRTQRSAPSDRSTSLDAAFSAFVRSYEAGDAVDLPQLTRGLSDQERQQLLERLDGYLAEAPRRSFNREAYESSRSLSDHRSP